MGLVVALLTIYYWVILFRAVISWVQPNPRNALVELLVSLTEPVLRPLRRVLPPERTGNIDLSPVLAMVLIKAILYIILRA